MIKYWQDLELGSEVDVLGTDASDRLQLADAEGEAVDGHQQHLRVRDGAVRTGKGRKALLAIDQARFSVVACAF